MGSKDKGRPAGCEVLPLDLAWAGKLKRYITARLWWALNARLKRVVFWHIRKLAK